MGVYGQLGDGTSVSKSSPTAIPGHTFAQLTSGAYHTCGLHVNGTAWCWGEW